MAHTSIFNIQELLEHILHFLAVDKALYPSVGMGHCPREFLMSQTVPVQGHVPDCPKLSHLKILLNYI